MRSSTIVGRLVLAASLCTPAWHGAAWATPELTAIALDDIPEACRDLGSQSASPSPNRALSARIALASCLVSERLRDVPLCDCEQSILDAESASAQSVSLLDEVVARGDPTMQILALHAVGELFTDLDGRLRATIPPPAAPNPSARELREMRIQMLAQQLARWRTRIRAATTEIERLARAHPELARNPAVAAAVRAARARQVQATR